MYYVYIRKIDNRKYIGFAIAINGYYFTQIKPLFSLFEKKIEQLAEQGVIICYSRDGELDTFLKSLVNEEEEVIEFTNSLQTEISEIKNYRRIPQVNFEVSINSQKIFNENDNKSEIIKASYTFGYTIILKQENYDTVRSNSYRNKIKQMNAQNKELTKAIDELKESNKQILRQKKQFKKVVFLFIAVIACGIGIYCLNDNLNNTQDKLNSANDTINKKNVVIKTKDDSISNLKDSISNLKFTLKRERSEKEELSSTLHEISTHYPIIVTSYEISSNSFKFKYLCAKDTQITVTLKAINTNDGDVISNYHTLTFNKGTGSQSLDFHSALNSHYYYYVVLIYDGHIIAGKYW
jgi:hypothetical protein